MKKVTIQEIAEQLHLSRNTVAKALNHGAVAYETKMEVIKTAHEMGYSKLDQELLALVTKQERETNRGMILVLFNRSESIFWNKILTGISDELKEQHYRMQLHIVDEKDADGSETLKLVDDDVKGMVFLCGFDQAFMEGMRRTKIPKTFFNAPVEEAGYLEMGNIVALEGRYAVRSLVSKAIADGKRTFAFIGHAEGSNNIQARLDGMLQALEENGIAKDPELLITQKVSDGYYTYRAIEKAVNALPYLPEVFVCINDDVAKYVASTLQRHSMQLAMDTVIIGFDNTIEEDFFKQDIMTVEIHKEAVGRRLVKTTIDQIHNPELDNAIITVATYPVYK